MSIDRETPMRVGVRIVVVAAVVGFLVLAFQGRAGAAESERIAQWEAALSDRTPLTAEERLERARSVLYEQRMGRIQQIHSRVLETGWRLWLHASPLRAWSGARKVVRHVWSIDRRGSSEDVALGWIEPGLGDRDDAALLDLYERLNARERKELAQTRLEAADTAMQQRRFELARVLLTRALTLRPDWEPALDRFARLQEKERSAGASNAPDAAIYPWEAPLAEALLTGDYESAADMGPDDPEAEFARAAARLLDGQRDVARSSFEQLEAQGGSLGKMAAQWLDRPGTDVEGDLTRSISQYRMKRVLGWIGGSTLAERGSGLSKSSLRAWKQSLTPTNIAFSVPARVFRGWEPDGRAVREAAHRYLELQPRGMRADQARSWLDSVGWDDPDVDDSREPFSAKSFRLPAARTPYTRLRVAPVVVSRRAIDSEFISSSVPVRAALEGAQGVWLEARPANSADLEDYPVLGPEQARRLIDQLAFAVEQGQFRPSLGSRDAALERLRRLDGAVSDGWVIVAEPYSPAPGTDLWSSFVSTVFDGKENVGSVSLQRGEKDIVATHALGKSFDRCPREALCLDREGSMQASVYGYGHMESGLGFGVQGQAAQAGVSLGLTETGPEASLVVPVGHWLGIDTWLPVEAQFSVGPDSFYIGPVLRRKTCSTESDFDESNGQQDLLPLGIRSKCVIRLY